MIVLIYEIIYSTIEGNIIYHKTLSENLNIEYNLI